MSRTRSYVFGLLCSAACASGPHVDANGSRLEVTSATLYPLREGAAWSYDVDAGDGQSVLATTQVLRVSGGVAEVKSGQELLRYQLATDGIKRAGQDFYLLRGPFVTDNRWQSGVDAQARIVATDRHIETKAGGFDGCLVIHEHHASSLQDVTTTYCPNVGPVRIESQMEVRGRLMRVNATLRGYATETQ